MKVMAEFLQYLVQVSEKAARVARTWKLEDALFDLLVAREDRRSKKSAIRSGFQNVGGCPHSRGCSTPCDGKGEPARVISRPKACSLYIINGGYLIATPFVNANLLI